MRSEETRIEIEVTAVEAIAEHLEGATQPLVVEVGIIEGRASRLAQPLLETISERLGGRVRLCKVDALKAGDEFCQGYGVERVPTILVFAQGKVVGRFVHTADEAEVLACIRGCLPEEVPGTEEAECLVNGYASETCQSISLEYDGRIRHAQGARSPLKFRITNMSSVRLNDIELAVESGVFARSSRQVRSIKPGASVKERIEIRPEEPGIQIGVTVVLRGPGLCQHLSKIQGEFSIDVEWPGVPVQQGGVTVIEQNWRNVISDGTGAQVGQPAQAPQPPEAGPSWTPVALDVIEVPFPGELAAKYGELLALHPGGRAFEGQRPGSFSGGLPKDTWGSRSFKKAGEHQVCEFREAPDGIYRLELFEGDRRKYLVIGYEKQGNSFVSHWRTNDRDYAKRYPDVFRHID